MKTSSNANSRQRRRYWVAALIALSCSISTTQNVVAQKDDTDAATGRNIRYVTQDAMYLANEQWYL